MHWHLPLPILLAAPLCVCLWAGLLLSGVLADYPCPQPPGPGLSAVSPSEAFVPHPEYPIEWYYITGVLCIEHSSHRRHRNEEHSDGEGCGDVLGFQLTTFLGNASGGSSNSPTNFIVTSSVISIHYDDKFYAFAAPGLPPIYPNRQQPFDLTFTDNAAATIEYKQVQGAAGQEGTWYNFVSNSPNASINLVLQSQSPMMLQGTAGYVGVPYYPVCIGDYYVSMPSLATSGVIRLGDETVLVSGLSWFDHEWGVQTGQLPGSGWIWMGIHLKDGSSLMLSIPMSFGVILPVISDANLQYANGSALHGVVSTVQFLSNWTSPLSGISYPTHLTVSTSLPTVSVLTVEPIFQQQEVHTLKANGQPVYFWEGAARVRVTDSVGRLIGAKHGEGYLELVGFTA